MPVVDLGYDKPLYILAFDHRGSFQKKLFGIDGQPTAEETLRIAEAKAVIGDGFFDAVARGAPKEHAGLLVDEQFGAEIARRAKREGHVFAMPVEKSGQDEFDFEYGEAFGEHIDAFDPTFSKVLVRFNPEGDPEMNRRQSERLKLLSDWLHQRGRKFLFELLVAAEPEQLEKVGGDVERFDRELRPGLMVEAIRELQGWDIEPDVWKIEGLDREEDCRRVSEQARSGGRDRWPVWSWGGERTRRPCSDGFEPTRRSRGTSGSRWGGHCGGTFSRDGSTARWSVRRRRGGSPTTTCG
jgi:myo-inositol catabolism protein IolC